MLGCVWLGSGLLLAVARQHDKTTPKNCKPRLCVFIFSPRCLTPTITLLVWSWSVKRGKTCLLAPPSSSSQRREEERELGEPDPCLCCFQLTSPHHSHHHHHHLLRHPRRPCACHKPGPWLRARGQPCGRPITPLRLQAQACDKSLRK